MDKNMHDRLVASEKRLNEIDDLLLQPETSSDMNLFKKTELSFDKFDQTIKRYLANPSKLHFPILTCS